MPSLSWRSKLVPGLFALVIAGSVWGLKLTPASALEVGSPAPTFALRTLEGKTIDTASLKDKRAALVIFWASW